MFIRELLWVAVSNTNSLPNQSKCLVAASDRRSKRIHLLLEKSIVMVTEVKVEDWSGKTGVKMVTLTSPKLQVNLVKIRNDR